MLTIYLLNKKETILVEVNKVKLFMPDIAYIDPRSLEYDVGRAAKAKKTIRQTKISTRWLQKEITFELIQHRFTATAKELIITKFPKTKLDFNEETRQLKWGPYGKFKFVYSKEKSNEIKEHITGIIKENYNNAVIKYST